MTKAQLLLILFVSTPFLLIAFIAVAVSAIGARDWRSLAKSYPAAARPHGTTFRFRTLEMAYSSSHLGITFVVSKEGLYIAAWGPFSIGRPPMLIPWSAMEVVTASSLTLETWIRVTPPSITLRITPIVFEAAREFLGSKMT